MCEESPSASESSLSATFFLDSILAPMLLAFRLFKPRHEGFQIIVDLCCPERRRLTSSDYDDVDI